MLNQIEVSYSLLKSEFAAKPLRLFYTQLYEANGSTTRGYVVYAVCFSYALVTTITSVSDISNFESDYKSSATSVGSLSEAEALIQIPALPNGEFQSGSSSAGRSFGYTSTNSTATKTVRATNYTPQGTDQQRSVRSTNANDTSAGTGARKVKITYFDASCAGPFTETVTMNGTTAVNTVASNIALIEKVEVAEVGSGGGNVGTIEIWTLTGGTGSIWGSIAASDNQTYWAHHYVATGKQAYIQNMNIGSSNLNGGATLNVLNPVDTSVPQQALDATIRHQAPTLVRPYTVPIQVLGPAIIFLNERPDANTAQTVFGGFTWVEY